MDGLTLADRQAPAGPPTPRIALADLLTRWGCTDSDVPATCRAGLATMARGYRVLAPDEHRAAVRATLLRLDDPALRRDVDANRAAFERGWRENLDRCAAGVPREIALEPGYVKPLRVMRWGGRLIAPDGPYLCHTLTALTLEYVFARYLAPHACVVEAGCGTGRHLRALSERFPDKDLVGLDWTAASIELLALLATRERRRLRGVRFDMLAPATDADVPEGAAVYTVHALEQLGERFGAFLDWLLARRPAVVVHHEPIVEWYDPDLELDHLAIAYHHRRGWLHGWWPALRALADAGRIEILTARRLHYGDAYTEGSLIVWRPRA